MICDKILFKGQPLLTIFHQGFRKKATGRILKRTIKVGRFNLVFTESYCDHAIVSDGWIQIETGLLQPRSTMNPYNDSTCAKMTRYCFFEKPLCIFEINNDEYRLSISSDDFCKISEFIKEYTGIDILLNPMALGDAFVFEPHEFGLKTNEKGSVIIEKVPAKSSIVVQFKENGIIVSSQLLNNETETRDIEIECDKTWNSYDIEVFQDGNLAFCNRDVSYITSLDFQIGIKQNLKPIKLNKIASEYIPAKTSNERITHIGKRSDYNTVIRKSEFEIRRQIKTDQPDDQVHFIKPNQLSVVNNLLWKEIESATNEIWLFDSYFSDNDGIGCSLDWLRIIANCNAKFKNIVFFCNGSNNSLSADSFFKKIKEDAVMGNIIRIKKRLGIELYQSKFPIHDRFLLQNNKNGYSGVSIGTSFNSLDRNFYCISKLSPASSKKILKDLKSWMEDGNIIAHKDI